MAGEYTRSAASAQSEKLLLKNDSVNINKVVENGSPKVVGQVVSTPFVVRLNEPDSWMRRLTGWIIR
jgi:hypothetical protein